jgi:hypothetical protein
MCDNVCAIATVKVIVTVAPTAFAIASPRIKRCIITVKIEIHTEKYKLADEIL